MSTILDKHGMTYANCLALQEEHLAVWRSKLEESTYCSVSEYCLATNREATDATQTHRVYRGQDLVQILMDWPDLKPCYAPAPQRESTVEVVLKRDVGAGELVRTNDYDPKDAI